MENTRYMYEYQNGQKARNIGFMKIDNQMDKSTIQIHARNMDEVVGILYRRPNGEIYVGTWDEGAVSLTQPMQIAPMQEIPMQLQRPEPTPAAPRPPEQQQPIPVMETEEIEEYITPRNVIYEKIQRQGLSRLPRKEWRIANNSFLLHGFYNYHHLLYIEEDGQIWIGVPGIYHEKEKEAANSFGFTEFRRLNGGEIELEEDEKNTYEDFGYWCRQIPRA